ncbi:MAG: hypothetical protein PIR02_15940 [Microbacterium enclense]
MASAVDFSEWVAPDLKMPLGGRTYSVPAPSVRRARKIIAAAVRAEVNLGIVKGEIPDEITEILDTIRGVERPGLGPVAQEMTDDDVAIETIDRMEYYAIFYWTRGKEYADALATVLWAPRVSAEAGAPAPKA